MNELRKTLQDEVGQLITHVLSSPSAMKSLSAHKSVSGTQSTSADRLSTSDTDIQSTSANQESAIDTDSIEKDSSEKSEADLLRESCQNLAHSSSSQDSDKTIEYIDEQSTLPTSRASQDIQPLSQPSLDSAFADPNSILVEDPVPLGLYSNTEYIGNSAPVPMATVYSDSYQMSSPPLGVDSSIDPASVDAMAPEMSIASVSSLRCRLCNYTATSVRNLEKHYKAHTMSRKV